MDMDTLHLQYRYKNGKKWGTWQDWNLAISYNDNFIEILKDFKEGRRNEQWRIVNDNDEVLAKIQ